MSLQNEQNGKEFSQEQQQIRQKLQQVVSKHLPEKVADEAQKIVDESFRKEQYQDGKSPRWKPRKYDAEASKERTERRALLVDSSRLIRSVEVEQRGSDIVIATDTPYAQVHNEGGHAGRGTGFTMPQREFMPIPGQSNKLLEERVEKWLDQTMDEIFK